MLYWLHVSGDDSTTGDRDRFWTLVTEAARRNLQAATLRTTRHLCQGRQQRFAEWSERLPAARATVAADTTAETLLGALDTVTKFESRLSAHISSLDHLDLDAHDDQAADRIETALEKLHATHQELETARRQLFEAAEDHPGLTPALEPVFGPLRRLARNSGRLQQLDPEQELPDRHEFEALRKARKELAGLREGAERFVTAVQSSLESIDERLASTVDNYSPERIDPVDRSILRLATWEILEDPEVPTAVAINEAVEIAKRMGSEDSARFVNGILDRLARDSS